MRKVFCFGVLLALGCMAAPRLADPGRSGVWGYVELVPRAASASHTGAPSSSYADLRYRDAELVDYTRPGFAVVYLASGAAPASSLELTVRRGLSGVRLEPAHGALGAGGEIAVTNRTREAHAVSCPDAGLLRSLAPGETLRFAAPASGALALFVPDAPDARADVFVSPGAFATLDAAGRYELLGVEPGTHVLRTWHPRFPPTERPVELSAGRLLRLDLEIGVGLRPEARR